MTRIPNCGDGSVFFHALLKKGIPLLLLGFSSPFLEGGENTPLLPSSKVEEAAGIRSLEWKNESARSALRSGLSSIAVRLYKEVLEAPRSEAVKRGEAILGLVTALINERRYDEAKENLEQFPDEKAPAYLLRKALLDYEAGKLEISEESLDSLTIEDLKPEEASWFYLIHGLLKEARQDLVGAERFYEEARGASFSKVQKAHFESILFRSRLLSSPSGQLEDRQLTQLREKMESSLGRLEGFQNAEIYALALNERGETEEAISIIEDQLQYEAVREGGMEDEFLLLLGLLSGAETPRGKQALETLLSREGDRRLQKIALQTLAEVGLEDAQGEDIKALLSNLIDRPTAPPLLDELYFFRGFLHFLSGELNAAEADANRILDQFPGSPLTNNAIQLLAHAAWRREPPQYRTAAGYLNRLRRNLPEGPEKARLGILAADCYYLNEDYENAANAYGTAIAEAGEAGGKGVLLFQEVMSEIGAGRLDRAEAELNEIGTDPGIEALDRWRAEWNLISKMKERGEIEDAFARVQMLLRQSGEVSVSAELKLRLMWLEAQLSIEAQAPEKTPAMVAEILTALAKVPEEEIGPEQRKEIISHTLLLQGQALFAMGEEGKALEIFKELGKFYPDSESTILSYLIEARYHASKENLALAQQRMTALADDFPESKYAVIAMWEAALYSEQRGKKVEAGEILDSLVNRYPDHELVFYARLKQADLLRELDDFSSAQTVYENLLKAYPDHPERYRAEMSLADCFLAQGGGNATRLEDAEAILERLVDLPKIPVDLRTEAGLKWGFALTKSGKRERAEEIYWLMIQRFLRDGGGPAPLGVRGRYWLARTIFELGKLLESEKRYEEAREVYTLIEKHGLPGRGTALANIERFSGGGRLEQ